MDMSERRFHVINGAFIGIGMMMIFLGAFGWFSANYTIGALIPIFQGYGADVYQNPPYIFSKLSSLEADYMLTVAAGIFITLVGAIQELRKKAK